MLYYYVVNGTRPGGAALRGRVACRGTEQTIEYGPAPLSAAPWDKRPLTLAELSSFAAVKRAPVPRLTESIHRHLEHKFVSETDMEQLAQRGRFLQVVQEVQQRLVK